MKIEEEIKQKKFFSEYQKAVVNIIFTANYLNLENNKKLKPFGITPEQFNILRILRGQLPNPASIKLLTERMLNKSSNASRLVEKLRVKGLVQRTEGENNRRTVDVKITQKGLDLLVKVDPVIMTPGNPLLPEKELIKMNQLLDQFRG
jgi:DNA-binding MarR family transcriptional regulator